MKKVFLTLLFVVISTTVFSQIAIEPGVRAGVNLSNITNSNFDDKTDFYIGVFTEFNFAGFYALQPELNYTRQGGDSRISGLSDLEIQYVSLAVANKFSPFKGLGLHFIAGPAINIKVDDNFDSSFNPLEGFDILIFGGVGYNFPFDLSVEARYNLGIIDIFGSNVNNSSSIDEVFLNKVIQIGATYKFDF